jgi:sarcosine oxidase delta subunit
MREGEARVTATEGGRVVYLFEEVDGCVKGFWEHLGGVVRFLVLQGDGRTGGWEEVREVYKSE